MARLLLSQVSGLKGCDWTKLHGVAFESDDWGFCGEGKGRPSHERLASLGHDMHSRMASRLYGNTLESEEDLERLYRVLSSFIDSLGRNPVFTANFVTSNPSFTEIEKSGFREFHHTPIGSGFPGKWIDRGSPVKAWLRGIKRHLLSPGYHGLTHFNKSRWLEGLRKGDRKLLDFFNEEMVASSRSNPTVAEYGIDIGTGVEYDPPEEQFQNISRGVQIFTTLFSLIPATTIPPHDILDSHTLGAFAKAGMRSVQSERVGALSTLGLRWPLPLTYVDALRRLLLLKTIITLMPRNLLFENWSELTPGVAIESFPKFSRNGSPVIVGTHRQNYVAGVDRKEADTGLRRLEELLKGLSEDPKVAFLTASEVSQLSAHGRSMEDFGDEILLRNYSRGESLHFVRVGRGYQVRDLARDQNTSALATRVEGGVKIRIPAGCSLSVEKGDYQYG